MRTERAHSYTWPPSSPHQAKARPSRRTKTKEFQRDVQRSLGIFWPKSHCWAQRGSQAFSLCLLRTWPSCTGVSLSSPAGLVSVWSPPFPSWPWPEEWLAIVQLFPWLSLGPWGEVPGSQNTSLPDTYVSHLPVPVTPPPALAFMTQLWCLLSLFCECLRRLC